MAKVGLKETLSLLAAGYKKKDIEALAAIDDELNDNSLSSDTAQETVPAAPEPPKEEDKPEEPDYKKMYVELLAKHEKTENTLKQLQQDNVHKDSGPAAAETKEKEQQALTDLVRGFM